MTYIEKALVPGETIEYTTGIHWLCFSRSLFFGLLLLIAGGFVPDITGALIVSGIGFLFFVYTVMKIRAIRYVLTNRRIIVKSGLLSKSVMTISLSKVESVKLHQGLIGRIFGCGNVMLTGVGASLEPFRQVKNPRELWKRVEFS